MMTYEKEDDASSSEYFDMHEIFNSLVVLSGSVTSLSILIQDLLTDAHRNFDLVFQLYPYFRINHFLKVSLESTRFKE